MKYTLTFDRLQLRPNSGGISLVYQARTGSAFPGRSVRLRRLIVRGSVDPSVDVNVLVVVLRRLPTAAGSFRDVLAGGDVAKVDPGSTDYAGSGLYNALSMPEMLPQNTLFSHGFYIKSRVDKKWSKRAGCVCDSENPLEILALPRADVDVELNGTLEVDQV
jgi:hypothetical protein